MDKKQVISLAGQAGFGGNQRNTLLVKLMALAQLVEQAEREACAERCEQLSHIGSENQLWMRDRCVAAIRQRSNV